MTYKEAHAYFENLQRMFIEHRQSPDEEFSEANRLAILALEKQIPKKPVLRDMFDKNDKLIDRLYECPVCSSFICYTTELGIEENFSHCHCGQAIDWDCEDNE